MMKNQGDITALYERLSRDDERFGDSTSIVNQKVMLENYAKEQGLRNVRHYTDDGYSGGSFDRPGWKRMIEDIEQGMISTVIAKDMSRIGRNYLEVGYYTEIYFAQKNIRFIAVSNNVDSENQGSSEFAPFLNIMNEWYLRDCSRKIKAAKRLQGNAGIHLAPVPSYGYKRDKQDKNKWIIDEEAAEVVRMIYRLCIDGNGTQTIARILTEKEIETPAYYAAKNGMGRFRNNIEALKPYRWSSATVRGILTRPEYLGYTVNFKTASKSYKEHNKHIINPPEKWAVFAGTQEPIVDMYTYQLAQKLIGTPRRCDKGDPNPLTGLVFCADCGAKMYNHRANPYITRFGCKKPGFDAYDCSAFKIGGKRAEHVCSTHYISTKALREVIRITIQKVCRSAIENREMFINKVRQETDAQNRLEEKEKGRKYEENKRRLQELIGIDKTLYESFMKGIISEERFRTLSDSYMNEQKKIEREVHLYEIEQENKRNLEEDINGFLALVDKYTSFEVLTTRMLNEFIDKVFVHKADFSSGFRTQKVEIWLNYLGKIDSFQPLPERGVKVKKPRNRYQGQNQNTSTGEKPSVSQEKRIDAARRMDRERIIKKLQQDVIDLGIENMSITPARLKNGGAAR